MGNKKNKETLRRFKLILDFPDARILVANGENNTGMRKRMERIGFDAAENNMRICVINLGFCVL
jgi:hypothetical protein